MPANLENPAMATGLERSVFIPIPKKGNAKECSKYHTIALMSHASRVMLKILQARVQQGTTEDKMAGWHHWLDGHEFEWTPGVGDGQGGLACCDSRGHKESDTTEPLNWIELNWRILFLVSFSGSGKIRRQSYPYQLNRGQENISCPNSWSWFHLTLFGFLIKVLLFRVFNMLSFLIFKMFPWWLRQ